MARHLAEYLEASAARYPLRTAVVDSAGESLTYAELDQSGFRARIISRLARHRPRRPRRPRAAKRACCRGLDLRRPEGRRGLRAGGRYRSHGQEPADSDRLRHPRAHRRRRMPRRCPGFRRECGVGRADHRRRERVRTVERHVMARCPAINPINPIQPDQLDRTPPTSPTSSTRRDRRGCQKGR